MHAGSIKTKLISAFLVTFVCLNAGGAVCVAYCQTVLQKALVSTDHCPLKKKSNHCDPVEQRTDPAAASVSNNQLDCCPMTVSFLAAPVEKKFRSADPAISIAAVNARTFVPTILGYARLTGPPAYRGPPRDGRENRVKHCIIRI